MGRDRLPAEGCESEWTGFLLGWVLSRWMGEFDSIDDPATALLLLLKPGVFIQYDGTIGI